MLVYIFKLKQYHMELLIMIELDQSDHQEAAFPAFEPDGHLVLCWFVLIVSFFSCCNSEQQDPRCGVGCDWPQFVSPYFLFTNVAP